MANDADTSNESMSSDIVSYDRNVAKMKAECMSKTPNRQALTTLMETTFLPRRQWIEKEAQSIKSIMQMFPCLKSKPMVRNTTYYFKFCIT